MPFQARMPCHIFRLVLAWLVILSQTTIIRGHKNHHHFDERELNVFEDAANGGDDGSVTGRCGTPEPELDEFATVEELIQRYLEGSRGGEIPDSILVPICFHVIYKSDGTGFLSDEDLQYQVDVLNVAFSANSCCNEDEEWCVEDTCSIETGIQFVWNRTCSTSTPNDDWYTARRDTSTETAMFRALRQGGPEVLNVYFRDLSPFTLLGYATFPWLFEDAPFDDGITISTLAVAGGSDPFYNEGDTLAHEIGHWLALFHTFSGGCFGEGLLDTPPMASGTEGCPVDRDSCPGGGLDPVHNFLDYSHDNCLYEFTPMQVRVMLTAYAVYRSGTFSRDMLTLSSGISSEPLSLVDREFQLFNYTPDLALADDVVCFSGTYDDRTGEPCFADCGDTRLVANWNTIPASNGFGSDCVSSSPRSTADVCILQPFPDETLLYVGLYVLDPSLGVQLTCVDVTVLSDGVPSTSLTLEPSGLHVYKYRTVSRESNLTCSSSASGGDVDMYAGFALEGVVRRYDYSCESAETGSSEECTLADLNAGAEIYLSLAAQGMSTVADLVVTCVEIVRPPITLLNGIASELLSLARREQEFYMYSLENPDAPVSVTCMTRGSSGDADLYLRWSELPTLTTRDCRSRSFNSNEDCSVNSRAGEDVLFVMVYASSAFSNLEVTCTETVIGTPVPSSEPMSPEPLPSPSNPPTRLPTRLPTPLPTDLPTFAPSEAPTTEEPSLATTTSYQPSAPPFETPRRARPLRNLLCRLAGLFCA